MIKSTATRSDFLSPNLSVMDRQIRFVVGGTMIAAVLVIAPQPLGLWSIPLLASIPLIVMSIIGWDPFYAVTGKSAYRDTEIRQRNWSCANLGTIDRGVRLGVGMLLVASLLTMNSMSGELVASLLAIPLITTALFAWDPIYAALGINSFASMIDVEAAEPSVNDENLCSCYSFELPRQLPVVERFPRAA